jgi:hypothetical protein
VVVVRAAFANHDTIVRHKITVLPTSFSMTRTDDGVINIHNDAQYEVSLSGYTLRGDTSLIIPEYTILLPRSTLSLSASQLEDGVEKMIGLYDTAGVLVASSIPSRLGTVSEEVSTVAGISDSKADIEEKPQEEIVFSNEASVTTSVPEKLAPWIPYIGLFLAGLLAISGLYIRRLRSG